MFIPKMVKRPCPCTIEYEPFYHQSLRVKGVPLIQNALEGSTDCRWFVIHLIRDGRQGIPQSPSSFCATQGGQKERKGIPLLLSSLLWVPAVIIGATPWMQAYPSPMDPDEPVGRASHAYLHKALTFHPAGFLDLLSPKGSQGTPRGLGEIM